MTVKRKNSRLHNLLYPAKILEMLIFTRATIFLTQGFSAFAHCTFLRPSLRIRSCGHGRHSRKAETILALLFVGCYLPCLCDTPIFLQVGSTSTFSVPSDYDEFLSQRPKNSLIISITLGRHNRRCCLPNDALISIFIPAYTSLNITVCFMVFVLEVIKKRRHSNSKPCGACRRIRYFWALFGYDSKGR